MVFTILGLNASQGTVEDACRAGGLGDQGRITHHARAPEKRTREPHALHVKHCVMIFKIRRLRAPLEVPQGQII